MTTAQTELGSTRSGDWVYDEMAIHDALLTR